jgi:hypothetical protein
MTAPSAQVPLKVSDSDLKGLYSNAALVRHTKEEFVLDFLGVYEPPSGSFLARVILSPGHAKRLLQVLAQHVQQYETEAGVQIEPAQAPEEKQIGFQTNK